ncbi:MAG: hypothetical protein K0U98_13150 [Deltaproteobacteria bacterium]|nr:hypothetical protein [Deltaproteobacteria bacterium]
MKIKEYWAAYKRNEHLYAHSLKQLRTRLRFGVFCLLVVWVATFVQLWFSSLLPEGLGSVSHFYPMPFMPFFFSHFFFARIFLNYRRQLKAADLCPTRHDNLWTWASFIFSLPTRERVFLPLLGDLEMEQAEALEQGGPRAARRTLWQGYGIFWKTVGIQLSRSALAMLRFPKGRRTG